MEKIEEVLIDKYRNAEEIRKLRGDYKKKIMSDKIKEQTKELKSLRKIAELEMEKKLAWKFKEGRKVINDQKKIMDKKIKTEMLKIKIRIDLVKQEKKIIRKEIPQGPKIHPLPYLKKNNIVFSDDEDFDGIEEVPVRKKFLYSRDVNATPLPRRNIMMKKMGKNLSPSSKSYFY
ncbi:hypothetical protein SteCoe_5733 [Stentor coeruleus]|uniref:Uncharacterized protein n=1 Tax=Stentor coeruleus TaxID=5963 RepID=A0A1R2CRV0_9CILI|nr:hypothetical protein SteCoe_5733 [Stentor coeruleus]